jgi:hypothetical protein
MVKRLCKVSTFRLTSNYSLDISVLPSNIPDVVLPPAFFTALFWLALWLWLLGIISIYISSIYVIEKYKLKAYAIIAMHTALPIGMSDLYLQREVLGLLIPPIP